MEAEYNRFFFVCENKCTSVYKGVQIVNKNKKDYKTINKINNKRWYKWVQNILNNKIKLTKNH